jgi:hypothetical protein
LTSAQTVTLGALTGSLLILFMLAVIGVPRLARLIFLHRLEVIRDDCIDAILEDRLKEAASVSRFLQVAETGANVPHFLTLPRLFALSRAMVDAGIDVDKVAPPPSYSDLQPGERQLMRELDERMCAAYKAYLNWGSPASWILRPARFLVSHIHPSSAFVKAEGAVAAVARERLSEAPVRPSRGRLSYQHFAGR